MKTLVIYTSQTGFTKKYAGWISEALNADIYDLKDVQNKKADFFDVYEAIIYAGWIMAAKVVKADWFLKRASDWKEKRLAVVAVGGSPNDNPDVEVTLRNIMSDEQRLFIKAFYCQGGFDYDKMKAPSRFAMKMFASALKRQKDEKSKQVAEYISKSYDISDRKFIEPVLDYIRGNV